MSFLIGAFVATFAAAREAGAGPERVLDPAGAPA